MPQDPFAAFADAPAAEAPAASDPFAQFKDAPEDPYAQFADAQQAATKVRRTPQELADDPNFDPIVHAAQYQHSDPDEVNNAVEAAWIKKQRPATVGGALNTAGRFIKALPGAIIEGVPQIARGYAKAGVKLGQNVIGSVQGKTVDNDPEMARRTREMEAALASGSAAVLKMGEAADRNLRPITDLVMLPTGIPIARALLDKYNETGAEDPEKQRLRDYIIRQAAYLGQIEDYEGGHIPSDDTGTQQGFYPALPETVYKDEADRAQSTRDIQDMAEGPGDPTNIIPGAAALAPAKAVAKVSGKILKGAGRAAEIAGGALETGVEKIAKSKAGQLTTAAGIGGAIATGGAGAIPSAAALATGASAWVGGKIARGLGTMAKEAGQELAGEAFAPRHQSWYRKMGKEAQKGVVTGTVGSAPMLAGATSPEEAAGMIGPAPVIGGTVGALAGLARNRKIEANANFGALVKDGETIVFATPEETNYSNLAMGLLSSEGRQIVNFWRGFFRGATNANGAPISVIPVNRETFIRMTGQESRGAYYIDDGRLLVNIQNPDGSTRTTEQIAAIFGHEGKHGLDDALDATQHDFHTALFDGIKNRMAPGGTPTPEFDAWISSQVEMHKRNLQAAGRTPDEIAAALSGKTLDYWLNEISADIGQALMTGEGIESFLLPPGVTAKVWEAIQDLAAKVGFHVEQPRGEIGAPTAPDIVRAIRQQLHLQGAEAMARLDARIAEEKRLQARNQMASRRPTDKTPQAERDAIQAAKDEIAAEQAEIDAHSAAIDAERAAEPPSPTVEARMAELERILATPPTKASTVQENAAYRKAERELKQLRKQFPRPITPPGAGTPAPEAGKPAAPAPTPTVDPQSKVGSTFNGHEGNTVTITGINPTDPTTGSIVVDNTGKTYRVTKLWPNGSADVAFPNTPLNTRSSLTLKPGTFTHVETLTPQAPAVPPQPAVPTPSAVAAPEAPAPTGAQPAGAVVAGGQAVESKPQLTVRQNGPAWEVVDEQGETLGRGYADESAANRAKAQFERETKPSFQLPASANGNDIIDALLEQTSGSGISLEDMRAEDRKHMFPHLGIWKIKLASGKNRSFSADEVARLLASEGFGDGSIETMFDEISKAIEGRKRHRDAMKDQAKDEKRQMKQATAEQKAAAQKIVEDAKAKATAAEKNPNTKAAQERIRLAQTEAILDAIGEDETGLHRVPSDTAVEGYEIVGNYDPENPLHEALAAVSGAKLGKTAKAAVARMQGAEGRTQHVLYRSAEKPGIAGEGGEGSVAPFTTTERRKDYAEQPAEQRAAGEVEGTVQQKAVIPIETFATKDGRIMLRFFTLDNILHNLRSIFDHRREKGQPNPYGDDPAKQEALIIQDATTYAENHRHGYKGDGSGEIKRFPDSNLPEPDPSYTPTEIPPERFNLLNAAMVEDAASKLAKVIEEVTTAREEIGRMADGKAKQTKQAALERKIARMQKLEDITSLADLNDRTVNWASGETNPYRDQLRAEVFDFASLKSPIETLHPGNILEVSDDVIPTPPGEVLDVRPTGFGMNPAELGKKGRPIRRAVQANFLPEDDSTTKGKALVRTQMSTPNWKQRVSGEMRGRLAWMTPDGRWINVGEHREAIPQGANYTDMFSAGYGRVRIYSGALHLEHPAPGARMIKEAQDTAAEKGVTFVNDAAVRFMPESSEDRRGVLDPGYVVRQITAEEANDLDSEEGTWWLFSVLEGGGESEVVPVAEAYVPKQEAINMAIEQAKELGEMKVGTFKDPAGYAPDKEKPRPRHTVERQETNAGPMWLVLDERGQTVNYGSTEAKAQQMADAMNGEESSPATGELPEGYSVSDTNHGWRLFGPDGIVSMPTADSRAEAITEALRLLRQTGAPSVRAQVARIESRSQPAREQATRQQRMTVREMRTALFNMPTTQATSALRQQLFDLENQDDQASEWAMERFSAINQQSPGTGNMTAEQIARRIGELGDTAVREGRDYTKAEHAESDRLYAQLGAMATITGHSHRRPAYDQDTSARSIATYERLRRQGMSDAEIKRSSIPQEPRTSMPNLRQPSTPLPAESPLADIQERLDTQINGQQIDIKAEIEKLTEQIDEYDKPQGSYDNRTERADIEVFRQTLVEDWNHLAGLRDSLRKLNPTALTQYPAAYAELRRLEIRGIISHEQWEAAHKKLSDRQDTEIARAILAEEEAKPERERRGRIEAKIRAGQRQAQQDRMQRQSDWDDLLQAKDARALPKIARLWQQVSRNDDAFAFPRTKATDPNEIAKEISAPGKEVTSEQSRTQIWFSSGNGTIHISDINGRPEIGASGAGSRGKKQGGGSQLYQAAFAWAHNNGKVIHPSNALTAINAYVRRTSNMLSSALRFGTTRHMIPDNAQGVKNWKSDIAADPQAQEMAARHIYGKPSSELKLEQKLQVISDLKTFPQSALGVAGLKKITDAMDANNIAKLAMRESEQVMKAVPSLTAIDFDFKTGKMKDRDGKEVTPADLGKLLEAAGKPNTYDKGIGLSTAQRAIITASAIAQAEGADFSRADRGRGNRLVKNQSAVLYMPEGAEDRRALLKADMVKQTAFFRQQMRAGGYDQLEDVPADILANWSAQWREQNPRENPDGTLRFLPETGEIPVERFGIKPPILNRTDRDKLMEQVRAATKAKEFDTRMTPITGLTALQKDVTGSTIKRMTEDNIDLTQEDYDSNISIVERDGRRYIAEGHNRIATAINRGDKEVLADVYRFLPESPDTPRQAQDDRQRASGASPKDRLPKDYSQDEWNLWTENLADNADTFGSGGGARMGGSAAYDMRDTVQNFADFARANGNDPIEKSLKAFKDEHDGPASHLKHLRQMLTEDGYITKRPSAKEAAATRQRERQHSVTVGDARLTPKAQSIQMPRFLPEELYHGTPHEVDRFATKKIGTGEGAQAYGHGLYFAQNKTVAEEYKKALAKPATINGHEITDPAAGLSIYASTALHASEYNVERARQMMEEAADGNVPKELSEVFKSIHPKMRPDMQKAAEQLAKVNQEDVKRPAGNLYTVRVKPEADAFLDWDKPLSQQSEKVKAIAMKLWDSLPDSNWVKKGIKSTDRLVNGNAFYQALGNEGSKTSAYDAKAASEKLASLGIAGIRYADQGSRQQVAVHYDYESRHFVVTTPDGKTETFSAGKDRGEAEKKANDRAKELREARTSNYVIFREEDIEITRRNGEPVTKAERKEAMGAQFMPEAPQDAPAATRQRPDYRSAARARKEEREPAAAR